MTGVSLGYLTVEAEAALGAGLDVDLALALALTCGGSPLGYLIVSSDSSRFRALDLEPTIIGVGAKGSDFGMRPSS